MYEFLFWLVVASSRSPCSLVSSFKPEKSHLCPVRGCCRLRWRKAGLELEPKAQNGRRGCGGSTRSPLGSPRGHLPRRIPAHVGGRRGRGKCLHFAYFLKLILLLSNLVCNQSQNSEIFAFIFDHFFSIRRRVP